MKILLLGTCQMLSHEILIKAANVGDTSVLRYKDVTETNLEPGWFDRFDLILTHTQHSREKGFGPPCSPTPGLYSYLSWFSEASPQMTRSPSRCAREQGR